MPTEVKLPELGENVPGGQVVDIKVSPGAEVREGQPLVEVEAEKASVEVPSPLSGRLVKFMVKKGDHVNTGQTLCLIDDKGNGQAGAAPTQQPKQLARPTEQQPTPQPKAAPVAKGAPTRARAPPTGAGDGPNEPQPERAERRETGTAPVVPAGPATRHLARELGVDLSRVTGTGPFGRVTAEDVKAFV